MGLRADGNKLLGLVSEQTGVGGLVFSENNDCVITLNDKVVLVFTLDEEDLNAIVITGVVGALPQNEALMPIMHAMLCGNYAWGQTEGGTLGVDESTGIISLNYLVALPLADENQFPHIVAKVAMITEHWMNKIKSISDQHCGKMRTFNHNAALKA